MCKIFVLKYYRGWWQLTIIEHTKCILYTNIRVFNFRGSPAPRNILTTNISQITVVSLYIVFEFMLKINVSPYKSLITDMTGKLIITI